MSVTFMSKTLFRLFQLIFLAESYEIEKFFSRKLSFHQEDCESNDFRLSIRTNEWKSASKHMVSCSLKQWNADRFGKVKKKICTAISQPFLKYSQTSRYSWFSVFVRIFYKFFGLLKNLNRIRSLLFAKSSNMKFCESQTIIEFHKPNSETTMVTLSPEIF